MKNTMTKKEMMKEMLKDYCINSYWFAFFTNIKNKDSYDLKKENEYFEKKMLLNKYLDMFYNINATHEFICCYIDYVTENGLKDVTSIGNKTFRKLVNDYLERNYK